MFRFDKEKNTVVVTGAFGFLGRHVCLELGARGYKNIQAVSRSWSNYKKDEELPVTKVHADLLAQGGAGRALQDVGLYTNNAPIKGVIHLAAVVGGIGANQQNPGSFMLDNLQMGMNLIDAVRKKTSMQEGGKFVQIGTVCSYPKYTPVPFKESFIWDGYPEETNAPYGIAKKALMELVKAYNKQYEGFNGISVVPVNLYGPYDNFNPDSSHVIPALIKKVYQAKLNGSPLVVWGTGKASREFLYVEDAARGIVDAFEKYESDDPVNLGTGKEIQISALVELVCDIMGFDGAIEYDTTKPDGQPRRCLDVSKAKEEFGFEAKVDFREGLQKTVDWYIEEEIRNRGPF